MARPPYHVALERMQLLQLLHAFDPRVAGTPPLGIAVETSDIDVLCHLTDQAAFMDVIRNIVSPLEDFRIEQWVHGARPIIAAFHGEGWEFEIFACPEPVDEQAGWRHFCIEARLLHLGGAAFRDRVMELRRSGLKTEPAFAIALSLTGDPYNALLELEALADDVLAERLTAI
ncbi:DUF4269 domain-containing protein [Phyllobacterium sp. SB3]|uniref:DUF4269 domain-containing protein n=1 Tax=Phyllobacterium sp. SB3 TaxID=3156073 RepID=UPI0032AEE637